MKTKLCKPMLVETNEKSTFAGQLCLNGNHLFVARKCDNVGDLQPQELILISLDPEEKIEVGDTVLRPDGVIVTMSHSDMIAYLDSQSNATKKIIATQDQLPQEYIQQFVEQYNNGKVEDVEIELGFRTNAALGYKEYAYLEHLKDNTFIVSNIHANIDQDSYTLGEIVSMENYELETFIKLINNKIQIVERKPILYTEEEVKSLIDKAIYDSVGNPFLITSGLTMNLNWFEQNKKK